MSGAEPVAYELRRADRDCAADRRRPHEPAPLQTLGVERETQAVLPPDLYEVASAAAKDVQIPGMGIAPEPLLDLQRQRVHAAAHVRRPGRTPAHRLEPGSGPF